MPALVHIDPPVYPESARQLEFHGTAMVACLISREGKTAAAVIRQSTGYRVLDEAALDAARGATWTPAKDFGIPTCSWVVVPMRFNLRCPKVEEPVAGGLKGKLTGAEGQVGR